MQRAVRGNFLFIGMDAHAMRRVFDAARKAKVARHDTIIQQGEPGDYFYIVLSGVFECFKGSSPHPVFTYNAGGCFGELALMYNCPRAATVRAATDGTLLVLERRCFRAELVETQRRQARKQHGSEHFGELGAGVAVSDGPAGTDRHAKQKAFLRRKHLTFALGGTLDTTSVWRQAGDDTYDAAAQRLQELQQRGLANEMQRLHREHGPAANTTATATETATAVAATAGAAARSRAGARLIATAAGSARPRARVRRANPNGPNYKALNDSAVDPLVGTLKPVREPYQRPQTPDVSQCSTAENYKWLVKQRMGSELVRSCLRAAPQQPGDTYGKLNIWDCNKPGWQHSLR